MGGGMVNRLEAMGRRMSNADRSMAGSLQRLGSGQRIATAADDPAGLSISERLRGQTGGVVRAQRNVTDAIGAVQTADGALAEVAEILQRTREIALRHQHGTLSATDRDAIRREAEQLGAATRRLRDVTFNGVRLLDGSSPGLVVQAGGRDGEQVQVALVALSAIVGDDVFDFLATGSGSAGSGGSGGPSAPPPGSGAGGNGSGSSGVSGWSFTWGGWTWTWDGNSWQRSRAGSGGGGSGGGASPPADPPRPLDRIDDAVDAVSSARAVLGAAQNRLGHIASKLAVEGEQLASAESRIRDADVAGEVVALARRRALADVNRAIASHAHVHARDVLTLLAV